MQAGAACCCGPPTTTGSANLDTYFAHLYRLLKPGGLLLNHGITAGGVHGTPLGAGLAEFIDAHIFPGGELVHVSQLVRHLSAVGLELLDTENLRPHYARTLWDWSGALERRLHEARTLTTDATLRAYRLYLAGSAMAFERGWLSIHQLLASRPDGNLGTGAMRGAQCVYPFNRTHMYGSPVSIQSDIPPDTGVFSTTDRGLQFSPASSSALKAARSSTASHPDHGPAPC